MTWTDADRYQLYLLIIEINRLEWMQGQLCPADWARVVTLANCGQRLLDKQDAWLRARCPRAVTA
jgi:hypothetical protein